MVRLPPPLRPLFPYVKPAYVAATRALAPTAQWLSRRAGGYLPVGSVATMEDAARISGGRCVTARPPETIERPPGPLGTPPELPLTEVSDGERVDRVAIAELPGGRVLGPHRAIVTGTGELVFEISKYFGTTRPREHPLFLNPRVGAPHQVAGRLGVLASRGDGNYYHFLFDAMSRLGVLEQCRAVARPEQWYVPAANGFQAQTLALFGITTEQVIDARTHPHVQAEVLVVPGPPAMIEKNPPWVVAFLRERLLSQVDTSGPRRRIYVTRGVSANNRSVVNEVEVLALLAERGFEPVDPGALSVREQIAMFATAEAIVAPHGAALANLAFASPGTTVIELFPAGCLLPDFWRMACGVPGLRYRYLSTPVRLRRPRRNSVIVRDIEVDLPGLRALLSD